MPKPLIAGNWKMNTSLDEAVAIVAGIREAAEAVSGVEILLCPPFISLAAVRDAVQGSSIKLGAQNMHHQPSGAFTGEIAPTMLQGLCDYVILGHSERRQLFGEGDELINRKVQAAFQHGLKPILCVGETLDQREAGQAGYVVSQQLRAGLADVLDITGLVVAYEPVWAIGTGQAATPEIAAEMMGRIISDTLKALHPETAGETPLLYGGSVNPDNVAGFAALDSVHGALVGGASLQPDQFTEIARLTAQAKKQ